MHIVELTTVTVGTGKHEGRTAEEMILFEARVSSSREDNDRYDDPGLIRWLLKQNPPHISPFQMVDMGLYISCGLDVADQFKRHWSIALCEPLNIQQLSMRYKQVGNRFDDLEFRVQGLTNRQVSLDAHSRNNEFKERAAMLFEKSAALYEEMASAGVALETARRILPVATMTDFYVKGSVRSWISYISQRNHEHAQKEHRSMAADIAAIFQKQFPLTWAAISQTQ